MNTSDRIQSIGDVHLESSLGADAYSETFRGLLQTNGRPVFVRVFAPEVVGMRLAPGRFLREFEPLRALHEPNLAELIDFGIDGGTAFTVTSYAPASVAGLLRVFGSVHPRLAVEIVRQAATGLAAAHARGLVHGQVHPGVLHLSQPPNLDTHSIAPQSVKVADVGLVHALAAYGAVNRIVDTSAWPYLCPEVARGRMPDAASDIYGLGSILIHLLRGAPLTAPASLQDIATPRAPVPAYQVAADHPGSPAVLQQCIDRATARNPEQRHASMREFVAALDRVMVQMDQLARERDAHAAIDDDAAGREIVYGQTSSLARVVVTQVVAPLHSPQQDAAATALREAVISTAEPPRPTPDVRLPEPERVSTVTVVDAETFDTPPMRDRVRMAGVLAALLLVLLAGVWFALGRDSDDPATGDALAGDDSGGEVVGDVQSTSTGDSVLARADATLTAVFTGLHTSETATSAVRQTAAATVMVQPTATPIPSPTPTFTATATATARATATPTPPPTATPAPTVAVVPSVEVPVVPPAVPVEPTPVPEPVCAYTGPRFEGYACSSDGVFVVTMPACDFAYVAILWGDGTSTNAGQTTPNAVFRHTFPAPDVYFVGVQAELIGGCSGVFTQTLVYEYAAS